MLNAFGVSFPSFGLSRMTSSRAGIAMKEQYADIEMATTQEDTSSELLTRPRGGEGPEQDTRFKRAP